MSKGNFIGGEWVPGDAGELVSVSPATAESVWSGRASSADQVSLAFTKARSAFTDWSQRTVESRLEVATAFQRIVREQLDSLALTISSEMGKPLWEAKTEAAAVAGKVDLAMEALRERRDTEVSEVGGMKAVTRYKPHGVLGVLGPFNLPAHLPNGHIVPALLAGNTVVFKPSELTPRTGEKMVEFWQQAGVPAGVINLVQGGRETGGSLVSDRGLDGILFTGSSRGGTAINQALAGQPQKIVALEMGGNNPLVVHQCQDTRAAAYQTILSAFITSGQRCTCARRLFLVRGEEADRFLEALVEMIGRIRVGYAEDAAEPFLGPVITAETGQRVQQAQKELLKRGATSRVPLESLRGNDALLSPGLLEITSLGETGDEEIFGPLLQVTRVDSFAQAIESANRTRYGLSAGLFSDNPECYREFLLKIRAGVVNWNRQTTGASGRLPFGGCGLSGNHRPSGYFAADYCSFPVASLESSRVEIPPTLQPGIEL